MGLSRATTGTAGAWSGSLKWMTLMVLVLAALVAGVVAATRSGSPGTGQLQPNPRPQQVVPATNGGEGLQLAPAANCKPCRQ